MKVRRREGKGKQARWTQMLRGWESPLESRSLRTEGEGAPSPMSPLSRGRTRNKQNPNPETLRHLFSEHKWMPCGFASAIGSSVGGWSYWLWKQPGHQVDHTPFSGVNEQLEGSRLSRTPGVSVVVGVEKRLPGWGSLFKDGLRSCKGSGLWLLGNVSSLNGDELTMRMTLQDDKGEEGDVQEDRRGWIGQLLARENGTKQSPRAPHPCKPGSVLVPGDRVIRPVPSPERSLDRSGRPRSAPCGGCWREAGGQRA